MEDLILRLFVWLKFIILLVIIVSHIILGYQWYFIAILLLPSVALLMVTET